MINNKMCDKCDHVLVCEKIKTIEKFEDENKKFIRVDIQMLSCRDFSEIDED